MLPSYTSTMQQDEEQQPHSQRQQQRRQVGNSNDASLEMNPVFLTSPAGGLLATSAILGLLLSVCGAVPMWSQLTGGTFCVFSGLLHFCGGSFLFSVYLFNIISSMPWYARSLALYYYIVCTGFSLIGFVYAASNGSTYSAAIASAVFAFLSLGVDIVLIVLSYMAMKFDSASVQSDQDAVEA